MKPSCYARRTWADLREELSAEMTSAAAANLLNFSCRFDVLSVGQCGALAASEWPNKPLRPSGSSSYCSSTCKVSYFVDYFTLGCPTTQ